MWNFAVKCPEWYCCKKLQAINYAFNNLTINNVPYFNSNRLSTRSIRTMLSSIANKPIFNDVCTTQAYCRTCTPYRNMGAELLQLAPRAPPCPRQWWVTLFCARKHWAGEESLASSLNWKWGAVNHMPNTLFTPSDEIPSSQEVTPSH